MHDVGSGSRYGILVPKSRKLNLRVHPAHRPDIIRRQRDDRLESTIAGREIDRHALAPAVPIPVEQERTRLGRAYVMIAADCPHIGTGNRSNTKQDALMLDHVRGGAALPA